jgi:hypothetical protein
MFYFSRLHGFFALFALAMPNAFSQAILPSDPLPPKVKSEELVFLEYQSSFSMYQAYADQPIISWRNANDTVGKIGGWRSYAKEVQQPQSDLPQAKPMVGDKK